jgi:TM2 domain-containing membrane protein YozV
MKNSAVKAFILSLVLPGTGQFYNRTYFRGVLWMLATLMFWIYTGYFATVCHLFSAVAAHNYAARKLGQEEVWPDW